MCINMENKMYKREKKWFKGGGPFSKINKLTTDINMLDKYRLIFPEYKDEYEEFKEIFRRDNGK